MLKFMQKRIIPYAVITVSTVSVVFSGISAKAKGDAVYSLAAGAASDILVEDINPEISDLQLCAGASTHVRTDLPTEEELEELRQQREAELEAERKASFTMVMAKTSDYVNVRSNPSTEADKVGVLYKDCGGEILERGDGWTKIQSGELVGWVSNDFLYFEEAAEEYAKTVCKTYATIDTQALRVRSGPSADAEIIGLLEVGIDLETVPEKEATEGWIAILYQNKLGYVSSDYVTLHLSINEGETIEEIEERERLAALEKAKLKTKYASVSANVDDITLLAALIQCEAGNQCYEGKLAVGAVVCNRIRSGSYPGSLRDVIYAPGQFGPATNGMLDKALANGVSESCRQAAIEAFGGATNVGGACHFRRAGSRDGVVIGDHVFY
ncbi:MAG: SH3 domain-containing protein [Lachnospiraceae bacterium]|nr:SH3 domain-containing protein [Lachnospiraceae bacterium]